MKKQLDTTGIANELKGASVYFVRDPFKLSAHNRPSNPPPERPRAATAGLSEKKKGTPAPAGATMDGVIDKANKQASMADSAQAPVPERYQVAR